MQALRIRRARLDMSVLTMPAVEHALAKPVQEAAERLDLPWE